MHSRILRFPGLTMAALVVACGGDTTTAPPSEVGPPASVSVAAGDNQIAAPGAAVATAPSVMVRDAAGHPVPGVAVAFSVDSGGGSLSSPSATTNASGIASAGTWTLGAAEGPQVLGVVAGSLAKVKIRGVARAATTTLATGTVSTSGSTITVNQPGSPLNGVSLTIQSTSVVSAAPISIGSGSNAGIDLPPGVTATSPALMISSAATLTKPAVVRFPITPIPGTAQFIGVFDPATGKVAILTPISAKANELTAVLPRFNSSLLAPPSGAVTGRFASLSAKAEGEIGILTMGVPLALLDRDFTSEFTAGVDNWDFDNLAIAWLPFLAKDDNANPATEVIDPGHGMITTSLWYFLTQRASGALNKRFRLQPDQLRSNRSGIRWAALANRAAVDQSVRLSKTVDDLLTDDFGTYTETQFLGLKAMMYFTQRAQPFAEPIPVYLYNDSPVSSEELKPGEERKKIYSVAIAIATKTVGRSVYFVVADNEVSTYRGVMGASGFTPVNVNNRSGYTFTFSSFSPQMTTPFIDNPAISSNYPKVLNGTVGEAEGWPQPELHWKKGKLDTASVILGDEVEMWWECPRCTDFGTTFPGIPPEASHLQAFQMGRINGGTSALSPPEGLAFATIKWKADSVASDVNPTKTGHALLLPQPQLSVKAGFPAGWLDWQTVNFRKMSLKPTPATLTIGKDTTATWTLAPTIAPPAGTTWSWVLVTSAGRDSVATTTPTHTRDLKGNANGTMVILAHEANTKRVIGRVEVPITAASPQPVWQILTISDPDNYLPSDPADDLEDDPFLRALLASPGKGLITVTDKSGSATQLELRILSSPWDPAAPLPTAARRPGEFDYWLGEKPTASFPMGPFFAGWNTNFWTQSSTDLNTGTMTGQSNFGTGPYNVKDAGVQIGPMSATRFTATRNGTTMTGTISLWLWYINEDGVLDGPPEEHRLPFTARRLR